MKFAEERETVNKEKLAQRAKRVIQNILYITVATATKQGEPWNSPVYSAFDETYTFYWKSWTENQHSKNIRENEHVFVVVYDSTAAEGTGFGVYMKGKARQLGEGESEEIKKALRLLARRVNKKPQVAKQFLGESPRRVFRFVPEKIWVNAEGEVKGDFVDTRIDITDEMMGK